MFFVAVFVNNEPESPLTFPNGKIGRSRSPNLLRASSELAAPATEPAFFHYYHTVKGYKFFTVVSLHPIHYCIGHVI